MSTDNFVAWAKSTKSGGGELSRDSYLQLSQPSERDPVRRYAAVAPDLYDAILNRCVEQNRMCMKDMMAIDSSGGQGKPGAYNIASIDPATRKRLGIDNLPARTFVGAMCTVNNPTGAEVAPGV